MKTLSASVVLAALAGLFSISRADSILLSDNFSGPSLDTTKWQTILPYGQSSITQAGGELTTSGRGILATVDGFSDPYVINGAFEMNSGLEHFDIALRSDLSEFGNYAERSGLIVTFVHDGQGISIQEYPTGPDSGTSVIQLASTGENGYNFISGQTYFFSILDYGTGISLAVNGVDVLSAATTYGTGDHIALYSREFPDTSTSIDAITISSVPEMGMTLGYLVCGLTGLTTIRRKLVLQ
jgi:hypothetical protein